MPASPGRLRGALLLGGGTVVAAVCGLGFQSLLSYHFGAGADTDAWFMSVSIFAFLGKLLMLGNLKSLTLPAYRRLQGGDADAARRFLRRMLVGVGALSALLAVVVFAAAPTVVDLFAPGFAAPTRAVTVTLVRIRVPALAVLALSTVALVALESRHRFGPTAAAQKILPAALMLALFLALADRFGIVGLGWIGLAGGVGGGAVALAAAVPALRRERGTERDSAAPAEAERQCAEAARGVWGRWIRFGASNAATTLGEWVFRVAASLLPVGLFSAMVYGRMVHDLLHGVVNDAAQAVSLPTFSAAGVSRDGSGSVDGGGVHRVGDRLAEGLGLVTSVSVPVAVFMAWAAPWVVALLFGRGAFLEDGMAGPAATALRVFMVGFVVQGANQMIFAAAFAAERSHLVNRIQVAGHLVRAAVLVPAVLMFGLVGLVGAQVGMNVLVLVMLLAFTPASWMRARVGAWFRSRWMVGVGVGTAVPAAVAWAASGLLPEPLEVSTAARFGILVAAAAAWFGSYAAVAGALRVPGILLLARRLGGWGRAATVAALAAAALAAPGVEAQEVGTAPLPADHWVLDVVETLEARGLVPAGWARRGPRAADAVEALLAETEHPYARDAVRRLREEAGAGRGASGRLSVEARRAEVPVGPGEGIVPRGGVSIRLGRPGGRLSAAVALDAGDGGIRVEEGGVGLRLGPVDAWAGRRRVGLGGGAGGGFTLSPGAGLDGLLLFTPRPLRVPVAGRLSAMAGVFPRLEYRGVDRPWLAVARVSASPTAGVAVGVSRAALFGGTFAGGPPPYDPVPIPADERGFRAGDLLAALVGPGATGDDEVLAVDVRVSLGRWGVPVSLWAEAGFEDQNRSWGDGAFLAGLQVWPVADRPVTLRYEYTGIGRSGRWCRWCDTLPAFWYQHTRFQDGWRVEGRPLGHPLAGYGQAHRVEAVGAAGGAATRFRIALLRFRRDRWNLLEDGRPGRGWGMEGTLAQRAGRRWEAYVRAAMEWGDEGWRAGRARAGVSFLLAETASGR